MIELPDDLPLTERHAVRVVVRDAAGRILLFRTRDVTAPEQGEWWELPGGGIDPGETYLDAALRELREETGIAARSDQVGPPLWRRTATFRYRQARRLQHEVVVEVALDGAGPAIDDAGRLDYEKEDYTDFRWWRPDEIRSHPGRFYPGRLPTLLETFLAGEEIDEPFELWS
ncbi:NUDIX domain-containing protein [Phenylobacterium sp.]|uniref:NUDIX hydrolase n=1 Tax=Phenylobacterium sp. TaxID=1871053 RepID=UPI00289D2534|nr:NUDIX domain-containing protein [Phenylobacterium sp.]